MPLAINVLKHNRKLQDENLRIPTPYLNLNDSIMAQIKKDFYQLKKNIISVHHLDIRKKEGNKYTVNDEIVEFTADELREGTKQVIESYMYGENAVTVEDKEYPWKGAKYIPPDIDK